MSRGGNKKKKDWYKKLHGGGIVKYVGGETTKESEKKEEDVTYKVNSCPDFRKAEVVSGGLKEVTEGDMTFAGNISIVLSEEVYNKIVAYTNLLSSEITGLGLVEKFSNNIFKVTELYLPKQTVSGTQCELDDIAVCKLMDKIVAEGKNPSMLRFWWHSHNSMGCGWSTTDEDTGKKFAGKEYLISLVSAHGGKMKAKMNIYNPIEVELDDIKILVECPKQENNIIEQCKEDIKENVSEETIYNNIGFHNNQGNIFYPDKGKDQFAENEEDIDIEGPLGPLFYQKELTYVWDKTITRYKIYKKGTEEEVEDIDAEQITGQDYNSLMWLGEDLYYYGACGGPHEFL